MAVARRVQRRAAPASRYGLGDRVLAAREPKLPRASTRLAAARVGARSAPPPDFGAAVPYMPSETTDVLPAAPAITPERLGLGPASFEWLFGDPDKALSHPDVAAGPHVSLPPMSPEERSAQRLSRLTARGGSPYGRGARISEGATDAPVPPARGASPEDATDAPVPPARGESPEHPLARLPVTPTSPTTEAVRAELRRAPREPAARATPTPRVSTAPPSSATPGGSTAAPSSTTPRISTAPPSSATPPSPATRSSPPASDPPSHRQRLLAGRRPTATPPHPLASAASEPPHSPGRADVQTPAPLAPTVRAPTGPIAVATALPPAAATAPTGPPPPPSPGPPPVRLARRPLRAPTPAPAPPSQARRADRPPHSAFPPGPHTEASRGLPIRPEVLRATPSVRPGIQRAPRSATPRPTLPTPAPAPAQVPAPRRTSLLRRALAALAPASKPAPPANASVPPKDFGDSGGIYAASAPKSRAHPPVALNRAPSRAPQPPPRAPAERSSQPLMRAPAGPGPSPAPRPPAATNLAPPELSAAPIAHPTALTNAAPASTTPTHPNEHADAAYRDLLNRVREEREQLGQIVSHPF